VAASVSAALPPSVTKLPPPVTRDHPHDRPAAHAIAIPLFPRFTALDAIGPYEVLQRIPTFDFLPWRNEPTGLGQSARVRAGSATR
jgi:hypothetical protein